MLTFAGCGTGHAGTSSTTGGAQSASGQFAGAALPPGVRAPDFTLTDQTGRLVSLSAQRGYVVALTFLSTGCKACVLVAQQIRGALDELGSPARVRTIFVSTDPNTDTRANAERFLARASLTGRAEFLTGALSRLRPLWHAYRVRPVTSTRTKAGESAITVLMIDKAGHERVEFGLEQLTPEALAHDIRLLEQR